MNTAFPFLSILFLLPLILSSCDSAAHKAVSYPKIGVIIPMSGDFAIYGDIVRRGLEEAATGKSVRLIYEDEGCEPSLATRAYNKLVNIDKVNFILGPSCGSPQKAVAPLAGRQNKLMMVTSSASNELYELSMGKVFAPQYSNQQESFFLAQRMSEMGFKKAVILYVDNEFSRAHEEGFVKGFDGEVVETFRIPFDNSYIANLTPRFRALDFDSIFIPDAAPFLMGVLSQLRRSNINQQVFSIYSAQMDDVLKMEGENAEGLLYTYPDIEGDAISYFPRLGTEIFIEAILHCDAQVNCVAERLKSQHPFDDKNVLKSDIILKTVKDGKFVRYVNEAD